MTTLEQRIERVMEVASDDRNRVSHEPQFQEAISIIEALQQRLKEREELIADYEHAAADTRRLTREIDVAINGENAAEQASLCDLLSQLNVIYGRGNYIDDKAYGVVFNQGVRQKYGLGDIRIESRHTKTGALVIDALNAMDRMKVVMGISNSMPVWIKDKNGMYHHVLRDEQNLKIYFDGVEHKE